MAVTILALESQVIIFNFLGFFFFIHVTIESCC